ncbi:hypothetical protein PV327_004758 [Microctonus hyperodae]|uniref:Nucleoporin p58/p45 n=1 Tax=Microctonus hyperodae TaxID=165561 RepID=A0AA39KMV7_MICHY|nr:hypothetical protein PV327_004758 [Microctonus hyperodae]
MSNFNFGTPTTTATNTGFGGFGVQKPATGFGLGGSTFGTPAASGSLTFGAATATPATSVPAPNFNFGSTTTTTASTLSLTGSLLSNTGTTTTTPSLFGATATAPLAGGLNFSNLGNQSNTNFGQTSTAPPASGLTFGAPPPSTLSFGAAPTGGLFGAKPVATAIPTLPATLTTTTTTSNNKGLGGLDVSITNKGLSHGSNSPTVAKENLIPNEIIQTIDGFKDFVKVQKGFSSDIARGSSRPLNRCAEDIVSLMEILTTLAGAVQRDRSLADKLKQETAKSLQNSEIAQRTYDTPDGLQYENIAPLQFFMELAENFEQSLLLFRTQIEATEKNIQTMITPRLFTPNELTTAMSKIHESLVAVAGKLQGVHAKVQQQKEQYLNLRKYVLKDSSNVFEEIKINGKNSRSSIGKITSGPTPFGSGYKNFLSSTAINSGRQTNYGTQNSLAWGNVTPVPSATNISLNSNMKPPTAGLNFNSTLNLTAPLSVNDSNSSFQLQKPPAGNKRGKH